MTTLAAISLLAPAMLAGAALAALPIVAHLLHRNARRPVVFPSIKLLRASSASQSSLFRLRRRALLLLRCLAVALLALAFAEPLWSGSGAEQGGHGGATVVVLDMSASTARRDGAATLFERERGEAGRIIEALHGGADVAEVILADDAPRGLVGSLTPNLSLLGGLLNELTPSEARADLRGAIRLAGELVANAPKPHRVIVVTDGQASNWNDILDGSMGEDASLLPAGTSVEVITLPGAGDRTANVALEARGVSQAYAAPGQSIATRVRVHAFGDAATVTLGVLVDGVKQAERRVEVAPGRRREEAFLVEHDREGPHAIEVAILEAGGDAMAADDAALTSYAIGRRRPVAILSDEPPGDPSRGTYFLVRALAPYGDARDRFAPRVLSTAEFGGAAIADARTLFVADVTRLSEAHVLAVKEHIERGGSVIWLCGGGALVDNLALLESSMPGLLPFMPGSVSEREGRLVSAGRRRVVLANFDDAALLGLGQIRIGRIRPCTAVRDDAVAVLAYDDGTPAMALRRHGEGAFALANFGASPKSGDLGRHGAFVALIQSLASELEAADGAIRPTYVGEMLAVECGAVEPGERGRLHLRGPDGKEVPAAFVLEDRSATSISVQRAERRGFYRAMREESLLAIAAVNVDPRESDPAALDADSIRTLIGMVAEDEGDGAPLVASATGSVTGGTPIWWLALLGVLLAIGLELALLSWWRR